MKRRYRVVKCGADGLSKEDCPRRYQWSVIDTIRLYQGYPVEVANYDTRAAALAERDRLNKDKPI